MKRLLPKQKAFADGIAAGKTATQSVIDAGYNVKNRDVAMAMGSQIVQSLPVRQYLESIASKSAKNIEILSDTAENEAVRLSANKDILDRAGYKAPEKVLNLNMNVKDSEELQKLADKLNEIELHSGTSEPSHGASDSNLD